MKRLLYQLLLLLTLLIMMTNVVISIYLLSTHSRLRKAILILYTISEALSTVSLVFYAMHLSEICFGVCLFMFLFSMCCGMTWTHLNLIGHNIVEVHHLIPVVFYMFVVSTFLKGFILNLNQVPQQIRKDPVDQNERIITPSSYETIQFHKFVNNKDSLQTLVPPHNSSLTNIFNKQQETYLYPISHEPSTQEVPLETTHLHDDQVLQNERTVLAKISNSLLPPHLQKGESDIILHRKQSEDIQNIPMIPPQNFFDWSSPSTSTAGSGTKKFISLQDWERNKQNWLSNNSITNLNLTILEKEEVGEQEEEIIASKKLRGTIIETEGQEEEEEEGGAPSLHSYSHGFKTPPPPSPYHKQSDMYDSPSEEENVMDNFDTFNSYKTIHNRQPRRLSISPTRSPSKSHSSSPIKKFFNNHNLYHHQHSKSMYNFDLSQHQQPKKRSSFLSLTHPIIPSSSASSLQLQQPRRTKSLSPMKRNILKTPMPLNIHKEDTFSALQELDLSGTPESQFSLSSCPSIGFGEYDREKWRRIKLKLEEGSSLVS